MEIIFSVIIAFLVIGCHGYSLTNVTDSVLGCSHNSTRFADGSIVPTVEPCLSCKCINANLICALRVCPEQAFPPPRGCVIVQKKNTCCPYMTCSKTHTYKDEEKKIITHDRKWYEQNIRNRIFNQNAIQRRIEDDSNDEQQLSNGKMCVHNGTIYRSGSAMTTSSLCTYCYCIEGKQKCVQPKCTLPTKDCEPILIDSSCCPIRYDCTDEKIIKGRYNTKYNRRRNDNKHYLRMTSRMQRSRGCLVDSIFYPEGHKLPANQANPCEICFCIGGSKRCAPKKCAPIIKNCRPIIPDGQCCPSSYDCNMITDYKTARGFTSRQYSDLFSLFFGDEDKENSTVSWDYETETEPTNVNFNTTNENGLLNAMKNNLNIKNENKQATVKQTNVPNKTDLVSSNIPNYNISDDDFDDDDDEEISLLDFLLKGESALTSTTLKPFVFNITSKPLLNGMTNSPMQIQPILPDNMKNESLKFSMLPESLYNMVKDDGSLIFGNEKINHTPQLNSSHQLNVSSNSNNTVHKFESKFSTPKTTSYSKVRNEITTTTTHNPRKTTTRKVNAETSTLSPKQKTKNNLNGIKHNVNQTEKVDLAGTGTLATINVAIKSQNSTQKIVDSNIILYKNHTQTTTKHPKPQAFSLKPNTTTKIGSSTTERINLTTVNKTHRKTTTIPKLETTTEKITTKITTKAFSIESTTVSLQPLTTKISQKTIAIPKISAVEINPNPSIFESDINYDYSEPTLPPSLPNLKIIPFLPADAVKNVVHKSDDLKSHYNYYKPSSTAYSSQESHTSDNAYSPFNIKPTAEKYPTYNGNIADDRIDYDTYKMPSENVDSLDYINVYAGSGNLIQPASFQMSVNSKLDYVSNDHKVVPSKMSVSPNKNLTVKPPLPPFEPEHEYDLYNLTPQPPLQLGTSYNEYNINGPNSNEPYSSEHNYNVPHFVTIPPIKEPPRRPVGHKDTVFSHGNRNKFVPPIKTEGGFVPKRTSAENYIPLHGANFYVEKVDDQLLASNLMKNLTDQINGKSKSDEFNQTTSTESIISLTTYTVEYHDPLVGVDGISSHKKRPEELFKEQFNNGSTVGSKENNIAFNQLYEALFTDTGNIITTSAPTTPFKFIDKTSTVSSILTPSTTTTTPKAPLKNLTNNAIPLKLITILNNTKKDSPTKIEIPQRKNNKIIDPTDEPLLDDTHIPSVTTEMALSNMNSSQKNENLTTLRDVFLSKLNRHPIENDDRSNESVPKSPVFLTRPINKLSPSFISTASFPGMNSLESKHNYQTNPIRSELDLIITELNKNKQTNDFSHTNNFSSENYQVLPADDTNIANTESYVVNPVDIEKLNGETKIFSPPHKDPAGLLKLAGCNIYGRMYRVGRIIAELSSSCLECRCTEVGVACTPLNC